MKKLFYTRREVEQMEEMRWIRERIDRLDKYICDVGDKVRKLEEQINGEQKEEAINILPQRSWE